MSAGDMPHINPAMSNQSSRDQSRVPTTGNGTAASSPMSIGIDPSPAPEPDAAAYGTEPQSMPAPAVDRPDNMSHDPDDGAAAATYGTRSRNRNSGIRPNYADDKELDLEIEASGRYQKQNSKKAAQVVNTGTPSAPAESTFVRGAGSFTAINTNTQQEVATAEEPHNQPAVAAPSKKRKVPGSSTTVPSTNGNPVHAPYARAPVMAQSRPHMETNMVSFEQSGARLNKKQELVADDGTAFSANGKCVYYAALSMN